MRCISPPRHCGSRMLVPCVGSPFADPGSADYFKQTSASCSTSSPAPHHGEIGRYRPTAAPLIAAAVAAEALVIGAGYRITTGSHGSGWRGRVFSMTGADEV